MRRIVGASLALSAVLVLPSCMQLGEYAEGAECAAALDELSAAITEELGISWEPDSFVLYPSGAEPWCAEWVETGLELPANDARRTAVVTRVAEIVTPLREGVAFTVEYTAGDIDTFLSPETKPAMPAP